MLDFVKSRDGLSNKEKNQILIYHNKLLDDKSYGGKELFALLMDFMKAHKITEQDLKDICKLSRAWPQAFKAAYLIEDPEVENEQLDGEDTIEDDDDNTQDGD